MPTIYILLYFSYESFIIKKYGIENIISIRLEKTFAFWCFTSISSYNTYDISLLSYQLRVIAQKMIKE